MEEIKRVRGGVEDFPDLVFSKEEQMKTLAQISTTLALIFPLLLNALLSFAVEKPAPLPEGVTSSPKGAHGQAPANFGKPNIVFILADNVGYGDLGSYGGGELRGASTARLDQFASEGVRLTQYLVEPGCTPSRAALMTGRYSIRSGLSLVALPGTPFQLSAREITMAQILKDKGYATAIYGKWHLGADPGALPTTHGFDEFYGILWTWSDAITDSLVRLYHLTTLPESVIEAKGPQVVEAKAGGPLRNVKPFTPDVRAEIDNELVAKSIDFMKRQRVANKPFFLYLPFSMGHFPNLPSKQFEGKSRIGQYGDKMMEGDYHVGQILDALKELGLENNTIVVFASDNGPEGEDARSLGNLGTLDMGSSGPFRGQLGEATEGSIRTCAIVRWPGHIKPGTTSYAMFSIMDWFTTFAHITGAQVPADRPIDGVDQTEVLFGKAETGTRDHLLTFIGGELVAVRWKQWRFYFTDMEPTGQGPQRLNGTGTNDAPMGGYPKVFNIEMDQHEDINVAAINAMFMGQAYKFVYEYLASVKKYPNPPAPNLTKF